jgi:Ca-activated chloride channel family protein
MWKGSAAYRAGQHEQAAQWFGQADTPDAHFNRGNALAHQGKLEEAIAAYEAALKLQPDMADAQHNKAIVEKLRQQQEQLSSNDNKQDQQDSQQQDQKQQDQQQQDQQQDQQQNSQQQEQQQQDSQQQETQQDQQQNSQQEDKQDQPSDPQQDQSTRQQENQPTPEPKEEPQEAQVENAQPNPKYNEELSEDEQALEQWLRQIPDDPGGLLRRKFLQESQLRRSADNGGQSW